MTDYENTKLLLEIGKAALEQLLSEKITNSSKKPIIDQKIKVYSSTVDYLIAEGKSINIDSHIRDEKKKSVSSILFLALRISATQQFNIKNFVAVFVPENIKQQHVAQYISNKIVIDDLKKTYTVNFSDDLAYQSSIGTESKVYIIPLVFSDLENAHLVNFSKIHISFLTDDNKIITTEVDIKNTVQISGFVNQRILIEDN